MFIFVSKQCIQNATIIYWCINWTTSYVFEVILLRETTLSFELLIYTISTLIMCQSSAQISFALRLLVRLLGIKTLYRYLRYFNPVETEWIQKTRPSVSENRCKLYPPERQLTKAKQPSLNLEGGAQGQISSKPREPIISDL